MCDRMQLWQRYLWFLLRSLCVFLVESVSATIRTLPLAPSLPSPLPPPPFTLLLLVRQDRQLISPPTSPGKSPLRLMLHSGHVRMKHRYQEKLHDDISDHVLNVSKQMKSESDHTVLLYFPLGTTALW